MLTSLERNGWQHTHEPVQVVLFRCAEIAIVLQGETATFDLVNLRSKTACEVYLDGSTNLFSAPPAKRADGLATIVSPDRLNLGIKEIILNARDIFPESVGCIGSLRLDDKQVPYLIVFRLSSASSVEGLISSTGYRVTVGNVQGFPLGEPVEALAWPSVAMVFSAKPSSVSVLGPIGIVGSYGADNVVSLFDRFSKNVVSFHLCSPDQFSERLRSVGVIPPGLSLPTKVEEAVSRVVQYGNDSIVPFALIACGVL